MPRPTKRSAAAQAIRGAAGRFSATQDLQEQPSSVQSTIVLDSSDSAEFSDPDDDDYSVCNTEFEGEDEDEPLEQPARDLSFLPTREENRTARQTEKLKKEITRAEYKLDGPLHAPPEVRGSYTGNSAKTQQRRRSAKRAAATTRQNSEIPPAFASFGITLGASHFQTPVFHRKKRGSSVASDSSGSRSAMEAFARSRSQSRAPSPGSSVPSSRAQSRETSVSRPVSHAPTPDRSRAPSPEPGRSQPFAAESNPVPDEVIELLNSEASTAEDEPTVAEDEAGVAEAIALDEEISHWLDVVDEDLPQTLHDFRKLAEECLRSARHAKNYDAQCRYADLSNFYAFLTRQHATRAKASLRVAHSCVRGPWLARRICEDARYFEKTNGRLPVRNQGKRPGSRSLLDDEDVLLGVQRWLRTQEVGTITPQLLRKHLNEVLLPSLQVHSTKTVSLRTAIRWMWRLGYKRRRHKKGVYWDGHERKDVVKARKVYLSRLEELRRHARVYTDDSMEPEPMLQDEEGDTREVILIYHDESAYHANDFKSDYWLKEGEQVLKKKDPGRLIMVSDFVCEASGQLVLNDDEMKRQSALPPSERLRKTDARVIIHPTSKPGGDDYWNMNQMLAQMNDAIAIAKFKWPQAHLCFIFDNSSCHDSLAHDALNVNNMNVGPGGRQRRLRPTFIPQDNPNETLRGAAQSMVFPADHPNPKLRDQAKGMRVVLQERGLLDANGRDATGKYLIGECKACEAKKSRKPHLTGPTSAELDADMGSDEDAGSDSDDESNTCCLKRMLSQQEDFLSEKSELWKLLHRHGCECLFLPKFHPELNPIELLWGWSKRYFRERSTGKFNDAQKLVPESLDACPLSTIRRFFRRVNRYMDVYRLGAKGILAEYAVKKYRSHRSITATDLSTVTLENEGKSGPGKAWAKGKKRAKPTA